MPFGHSRSHSRTASPQKEDHSSNNPYRHTNRHSQQQLHPSDALAQASLILGSVGAPGRTSSNSNQNRTSMSNAQRSPTVGSFPSSVGGGGGQETAEHVKRQQSFRTHEDSAIQTPPLHYNEYSAPPQQQYQPYPGTAASAGRPHPVTTQSTGNINRDGVMRNAIQSSNLPSDLNTKYLPITHHSQQSASTSALPLEPQRSGSSARGKYGNSGSMGNSGGNAALAAMTGGYGLDQRARESQPEPATPKEYSHASKWNTIWPTYAIDWCKWPLYGTAGASGYAGQTGLGRVAIGSHCEDSHNYISILNAASKPSPIPYDEPSIEFSKFAEASLTYPITRILWEPPTASKPLTDLLATSGDHLRLWSLPNTAPAAISTSSITSRPGASASDLPTKKLSQLALLSNSKSTDFTAPLTSLDWNPISPSLIITSSIDTTCTIWDIPTLTAKTQLIAHDKEVFDVRFMSGSVDVFASCGADGSVRMFDLRSLDHSTIIYEPVVKDAETKSPGAGPTPIGGTGGSGSTLQGPPPLLRLSASPHDPHLLATFADNSPIIRILDVRQPGQALVELRGHSSNLNCIEWSPHRRGILAGGGDDSLVLVWDLAQDVPGQPSLLRGKGEEPRPTLGGTGGEGQWRNPVSGWRCDYEVNNLSWAPGSGGGMNSVESATGGGVGKGEWLGVCAGKGVVGVKI